MPGACAYHLLRKSNARIAELIDENSHMHDLLNSGGSVQRFDSAGQLSAAPWRSRRLFFPGRWRLWRPDPARSGARGA
jgi:hypothetical protein